ALGLGEGARKGSLDLDVFLALLDRPVPVRPGLEEVDHALAKSQWRGLNTGRVLYWVVEGYAIAVTGAKGFQSDRHDSLSSARNWIKGIWWKRSGEYHFAGVAGIRAASRTVRVGVVEQRPARISSREALHPVRSGVDELAEVVLKVRISKPLDRPTRRD